MRSYNTFDDLVRDINLESPQYIEHELDTIFNAKANKQIIQSFKEYEQIMHRYLMLEIWAYIKQSVNQNHQNDHCFSVASVWPNNESYSASYGISAMISISPTDNNVHIRPHQYMLLLWNQTQDSTDERSNESQDPLEPHLIVRVDAITRNLDLPHLAPFGIALFNGIQTTINITQAPLLSRIMQKHGNQITAIPISDVSAFKARFTAISHVSQMHLRFYLMGTPNIKYNKKSYNLWKYVRQTKGVAYYETCLNKFQFHALKGALAKPLELVEGGAATGKTKCVLLSTLKCVFNALEMRDFKINRRYIYKMGKKLKKGRRISSIKSVVKEWQRSRIGVFGASKQAINEIVTTILETNSNQNLTEFQRYSEIPIQRIGDEFTMKDSMIKGQYCFIFDTVHYYLGIKWTEAGFQWNKDYEKELEQLLETKKLTIGYREQALMELIKLPKKQSINECEQMGYLVTEIRFLQCECECIDTISICEDYTTAQTKVLRILINHSKVVFCTTNMMAKLNIYGESGTANAFDYGLFDECNQLTESECLIALQHCKMAALLQDRQAFHPNQSYKHFYTGKYSTKISESIVDRLSEYMSFITLQTQYRMHPEIALFSTKYVYDKKLKNSLQTMNNFNKSFYQDECGLFKPFLFFDTRGITLSLTECGLINQRECNDVKFILTQFLKKEAYLQEIKTIGIIAAHEGQKRLISQQLKNEIQVLQSSYVSVSCGTLDEFQGAQRDIIIVSCVSSGEDDAMEWDPFNVNVLMTRARYGLWIFGNTTYLLKNAAWRCVINNAEERKCIADLNTLRISNGHP
eukprot:178337_1